MARKHHVRTGKGIQQRPSEGFDLAREAAELAQMLPSARKLDARQTELHELFNRLAQLVDTVAESRHIETMEAYSIINSIINYYQI